MLDAHSIRIKRTWERRINERLWKRHNAYGRRSISRICWLPIVLQQKNGPEQGNCLPIFGTFSILLHVHCAPFLSFSTIYVLLQLVTLLASMHIAIFRYFVFLMLLPVHTFFLHSSFLVPLCNVHNFFFNF